MFYEQLHNKQMKQIICEVLVQEVTMSKGDGSSASYNTQDRKTYLGLAQEVAGAEVLYQHIYDNYYCDGRSAYDIAS